MAIQGLPRGKRSQFFRAVVAILKADPALSGVVRTWRSFEGGPDDYDAAPPTSAECPLVRLSYASFGTQRADSASYTAYGRILIEVYTDGLAVDDVADLWEAVEAALQGDKPYAGTSVMHYLANVAVVDPLDGVTTQGRGAFECGFADASVAPAGEPGQAGNPVTMWAAKGAYVGMLQIIR